MDRDYLLRAFQPITLIKIYIIYLKVSDLSKVARSLSTKVMKIMATGMSHLKMNSRQNQPLLNLMDRR
jgi:hypothetical protein